MSRFRLRPASPHRGTSQRGPFGQRCAHGYTLLELMIALAMLSVLVTLIWGLLSTFSQAELRAERIADRLQLLRGVRQHLEHDLQMTVLLAAESSGEPSGLPQDLNESRASTMGAADLLSANRQPGLVRADQLTLSVGSTGEGGFSGDSLGFTCTVSLDSNPAAWLASLVVEPGGPLGGDAPGSGSATTAEVRYRLESQVWGEEEVAFLTRELTSQRADSPSALTTNPSPDEFLDAADLYRLDDESQPAAATETQRLELGPFMGARFRYCDGSQWLNSWDSDNQQGLPVAVELSFDLPPNSLKPPVAEFDLSDDADLIEENDSLTGSEEINLDLVDDEPLLEGADLYGPDAAEESRDYRIVVFVRGSSSSKPAATGGDLP